MDVHPDFIVPKRYFADSQAIVPVSGDVVFEKALDIISVVGMNGTVRLSAFVADAGFAVALHHLGVFAGTPDGTVSAVSVHAHERGVIIQRRKESFVKARFKIQHINIALPPAVGRR